ncbi:hypothetical protein MNV49_000442 [Pseudohyphozyma bogoriensis]|nr:hypothetical protein MNV49_000442 [Pseudohyphozyma bogoriensis]
MAGTLLSLEGKVALITAFLAAGIQGLTIVDLSSSALSELHSSLPEAEQERVITVVANVASEDDTIHYVAKTVEAFGQLDISVQSFLGLKHSAKAMLASPSGGKGCSIVLVASQLGLDGAPLITPYVASKFAVRGMVASASQELGEFGIRVNCIAPGPVETPLAGKPEEIAQGILFLGSPASSLSTGTTLKMDAGWSRNEPPPFVVRPGDTPFRTAERYWKRATDLSGAFDANRIVWDEDGAGTDGRTRGVWRSEKSGRQVVCWKVRLGDLGATGMGQSRWKGKAKEEEEDYGIVVTAVPGLVFLPSILPPTLQRSLTRESLRHSKLPNLTSLSAHYDLPPEGLWAAWEAGRGDEIVPRNDIGKEQPGMPRQRVDFDPVTNENWKDVMGRGEALLKQFAETAKKVVVPVVEGGLDKGVSVDTLLSRIRWTNVGWHYDWASKSYAYERGQVPVPPLIYECCSAAVATIPWDLVFDPEESVPEEERVWKNWAKDYKAEAGVINFVRLVFSRSRVVDIG